LCSISTLFPVPSGVGRYSLGSDGIRL
jgi:hypothetical protein